MTYFVLTVGWDAGKSASLQCQRGRRLIFIIYGKIWLCGTATHWHLAPHQPRFSSMGYPSWTPRMLFLSLIDSRIFRRYPILIMRRKKQLHSRVSRHCFRKELLPMLFFSRVSAVSSFRVEMTLQKYFLHKETKQASWLYKMAT